MGSQASQDLKVMGPWVPMIVVLIIHLVMGLDISLGGANDDPRLGYVSLGLFAVTAAGSFYWRRQPHAMALFCFGLTGLQIALVLVALVSSAIDFGLPVLVILVVILGALQWAAWMFRKRSLQSEAQT